MAMPPSPIPSSPSSPSPGTPPPDIAPPGPDESGDSGSSLSLSPEQFKAAKGEYNCKPGDVYTGNLTLKVSSVGDDGSATFDVMDVADFAPVSGGAPDAEGLGKGPTILKGVSKSLQF